jgi:hypothetical protein
MLFAMAAGQAAAGTAVFTADSAHSSLTLSGNVVISGTAYPIQSQGSGSLTSTYSGQIFADLTPPYLHFTGGSSLKANTNGNWQPAAGGAAGSAPADFGGQITPPLTTGYAAGRNFQFDLNSPTILLTNGGFDASNLTFTYQTNIPPVPILDYRVTSFIPADNTNGTAALSGTSTNGINTASLTNNSGMLYLSLPINTSMVTTSSVGAITLVLTGQLVATAPASDWVFPVTIGLTNGQVTLEWPSLPGQHFTVQAAPSLSGAWNAATGTMTKKTSTTAWTGSQSGNVSFYRVFAGP